MCENKASGASRRLTFKRMLSQPCISTIKSSSHLRIRQEGRSDMCVCVCVHVCVYVCACARALASPVHQNKIRSSITRQRKLKSRCVLTTKETRPLALVSQALAPGALCC